MIYDFDDAPNHKTSIIRIADIGVEEEQNYYMTSLQRKEVCEFNRALKRERDLQAFVFRLDEIDIGLKLPLQFDRHSHLGIKKKRKYVDF